MERTASTSLQSAAFVAITLCLSIVLLQAQVAPIPPVQANVGSAQPKGTAVIRGHVFDSETGRPLRRAMIRVAAPDVRIMQAATTDEQGSYEVSNLPAGHFVVTASKANYVTSQYGEVANRLDSGTPIEIRDGQTIEKVDVALARGGVISGRVVDEYGDPVPNAQVQAMRSRFDGVRRRLVAAGRNATTDDLGDYRLFGLTPGDYYVSAVARTGPTAPGDEDAPGYAVTFAPGTASSTEAQRITVAASRLIDGVNVALAAVKTAQVSGAAVSSQGTPMASAHVELIDGSGDFTGRYGAQAKPDGTFLVTGVAPGDYTIRAQMPFKRGEIPEIATASISVAGRKIEGVQLVALAPVTISGTVLLDPAAGTTRASAISLMVTPLDSLPGNALVSMAQLQDDFSFEAKASPGMNTVRVNNMPVGMGLRAIRAGGIDVTDTGFAIKPNENVSGIEIELTSHPITLSGQLTDGHGAPSSGAMVIVFPRDEQKWSRPSGRDIKVWRPDQNGQYKFTDLAPGDYYVAITDTTQQGADTFRDPELLKQLISGAMSISLNEGDTRALDLKQPSSR